MILPDVNLLVHAHNRDSPVHEAARRWWDGCLMGTEGVGLAWVVILGFIRITTHPRVLLRPLPVGEVLDRIESWLRLPHVHVPQPSNRHFPELRENLERIGTAGNMTTDAHLATLAAQRGYVLYTTDTDFLRFPELRWVNPCR
ncbi:MAG: PIN domain-containing protein [Acidobacteria bacterium]|nr:PIN domain-containing protein [Acidobacteriota bacterium]